MAQLSRPSSFSTVNGNLPEETDSQIDRSARPIRVLVAERSEVLRLGFRQFVESRDGLALVGETATRDELKALSAALKPDVLLLDVHLATSDGFQIARAVKALNPSIQILICGQSENIDDIRAVLDTSVRGYLLKHACFEEVESAIYRVHAGQDYIAEDLAKRLLQDMTDEDTEAVEPSVELALTTREQEVLTLARSGYTNRQIGDQLHLAQKTITRHLTSIYRKLGVRNRVQAINAAAER